MAILMLQDQEKLDVQEPICTYLPDCPAAWEPITIHHLLCGSSGLEGYLWHIFDWNTPLRPEEVISVIRDMPLRYQPGEEIDLWVWGSEGFLLAQIIEQASGTTYDEILQQRIFAPSEMQDTEPVEPQDNLALRYTSISSQPASEADVSLAHGVISLASTVEDLLRWDQALYSEQTDMQALVDRMLADHGPYSGYRAGPAKQAGLTGAAYAWAIGEQFGHRYFRTSNLFHGFSNFVARYPDDRAVIIVLSNQGSIDAAGFAAGLAKILFGAG